MPMHTPTPYRPTRRAACSCARDESWVVLAHGLRSSSCGYRREIGKALVLRVHPRLARLTACNKLYRAGGGRGGIWGAMCASSQMFQTQNQGECAFDLCKCGGPNCSSEVQQAGSSYGSYAPADCATGPIHALVGRDLGSQRGRCTGTRDRNDDDQILRGAGVQLIDGHDYGGTILAGLSGPACPERYEPDLASAGLTRCHRRELPPTHGPRRRHRGSRRPRDWLLAPSARWRLSAFRGLFRRGDRRVIRRDPVPAWQADHACCVRLGWWLSRWAL
jgi:hypothetical protein